MQTIKAYEFKDLNKDIQLSVYNQVLNEVIESNLEFLYNDFNNNYISENEFYNVLGCSKYYAESTSWFIPSCYYEHNKSEVNRQVKLLIENMLFNDYGKYLQSKFKD